MTGLSQPGESNCRWCGAPATHERVVEPDVLDPKTKKVRKLGIRAAVCDQHNAMFDREERRIDLRKQIARLESAERRSRPFSSDTLAAARNELRELSR